MTCEEAKRKLLCCVEWEYSNDYAIAVEVAVEALEKQIPKKPKFVYLPNIKAFDEPIKTDAWNCPACGRTYNTKEHHCLCGQALDWSE